MQMYEAAKILCEGTDDSLHKVMMVLEDATSPITNKYREKLYKSIVDRSHVDFGDIPKSRGDITRYSGFKTMQETLDILIHLGREHESKELVNNATVIITSIENLRKAKPVFVKAFAQKNSYIELEYKLYVYTCVEATTSLISAFVSDIQTDSSTMKITLKNTKYRADKFFIDNLNQFNNINKNNQYVKYLTATLEADKKAMTEAVLPILVGAGAVLSVALSIIPITRSLIYHFSELRRKLSETFATQAYFIQLNKNCVEYNNTLDPKKKKKILEKQQKVQKVLLSLSDRLAIGNARAYEISQKQIEKDNRTMTIDGIRDEISDSDINIV